MSYQTSGGRILTWSLEAHVVDHCNLRCLHCCTLSPRLGERFVDPADLERDLRAAADALRPNVFKLTGGEPLLHPRLLDCIAAVRASGIAAPVSLTTNGLRLRSMPDALFEALDRLTVSRYTSAPVPDATLDDARARCARFGVRLTVKDVGAFQRMDADPPFAGADARRARWDACWVRARCHMVYAGRFYTCTRPPHLFARVQAFGVREDPALTDGVDLAGDRLLERLLAYLESDTPLASCAFCLGAGGGWEPHAQGALPP